MTGNAGLRLSENVREVRDRQFPFAEERQLQPRLFGGGPKDAEGLVESRGDVVHRSTWLLHIKICLYPLRILAASTSSTAGHRRGRSREDAYFLPENGRFQRKGGSSKERSLREWRPARCSRRISRAVRPIIRCSTDRSLVKRVGGAGQLDLAVERLVRDAEQRAVGDAQAIALGRDGAALHVDRDGAGEIDLPPLLAPAELPVAVVVGDDRAGAQALLQLVALFAGQRVARRPAGRAAPPRGREPGLGGTAASRMRSRRR